GQKVAIVTPKPQTTRRRIVGIRNDSDAQMIFIDMPGMHDPRSRLLNQRMVDLARRCLAESEVLVAMVEAGERLHPGDRAFLGEVRQLRQPKIVAINKIDSIARMRMIP